MDQPNDRREVAVVFDTISRVLGIDVKDITLDSRIEDLAQDSVHLFSLIVEFERYYQAEVDYNELLELTTVGDIVRYVGKFPKL